MNSKIVIAIAKIIFLLGLLSDSSMRRLTFSLSPRERAGVRGKGPLRDNAVELFPAQIHLIPEITFGSRCRQYNFGVGLFKLPLLCLLLLCFFLKATPVTAQAATEYQVKAVFLFRFAEFVVWPSDAFETPQSPIVLGILGTNPFGNALPEAVRGESVSGRHLIVKQFRNVQEIGSCHVLFISRSEAAQLPTILASLKGRRILTVSDAGNFLAQGGMIQFVTFENRVRFKINRDSAEEENLKISSKLLRLALSFNRKFYLLLGAGQLAGSSVSPAASLQKELSYKDASLSNLLELPRC